MRERKRTKKEDVIRTYKEWVDQSEKKIERLLKERKETNNSMDLIDIDFKIEIEKSLQENYKRLLTKYYGLENMKKQNNYWFKEAFGFQVSFLFFNFDLVMR